MTQFRELKLLLALKCGTQILKSRVVHQKLFIFHTSTMTARSHAGKLSYQDAVNYKKGIITNLLNYHNGVIKLKAQLHRLNCEIDDAHTEMDRCNEIITKYEQASKPFDKKYCIPEIITLVLSYLPASDQLKLAMHPSTRDFLPTIWRDIIGLMKFKEPLETRNWLDILDSLSWGAPNNKHWQPHRFIQGQVLHVLRYDADLGPRKFKHRDGRLTISLFEDCNAIVIRHPQVNELLACVGALKRDKIWDDFTNGTEDASEVVWILTKQRYKDYWTVESNTASLLDFTVKPHDYAIQFNKFTKALSLSNDHWYQ